MNQTHQLQRNHNIIKMNVIFTSGCQYAFLMLIIKKDAQTLEARHLTDRSLLCLK